MQNMQKKYVKPFAICRIAVYSDFAYSAYVCTPHFADAAWAAIMIMALPWRDAAVQWRPGSGPARRPAIHITSHHEGRIAAAAMRQYGSPQRNNLNIVSDVAYDVAYDVTVTTRYDVQPRTYDVAYYD